MGKVIASQSQAPQLHLSLLEGLVARLPLPYWAGSLLLSIVFGPPGFLVFRYFDTGSFDDGLIVFFHGLHPVGLAQQIVGLVLWTLFLFLALITPRYIRLKIQEGEVKISPLVSGGGEEYRRSFIPNSYTLPAILLAGIIVAGFANFIAASLRDSAGIFEWLYYLINIPITYLAIGTALWSYFGALWGLYRLGKQPLSLTHPYEDGTLGVRPIGSLSLSISYAYFGLLGLIVIIVVLYPFVDPLGAILVMLTAVGTGMFFLPLRGVHRQMLKYKRSFQSAIHQQWRTLLADLHSPHRMDGAASLDDVRAELSEVKQALTLEAAERKVNAVSTWPIDTTILGKLAAIILSILVAIITSRIIKLLEQL